MYGVNVHRSTLCQFLKKNGFIRHKMKIVTARQDKHLREPFAVDVSLYDSSVVVFMDETGTDMS